MTLNGQEEGPLVTGHSGSKESGPQLQLTFVVAPESLILGFVGVEIFELN